MKRYLMILSAVAAISALTLAGCGNDYETSANGTRLHTRGEPAQSEPYEPPTDPYVEIHSSSY